jgi:hypothetical protein
MPMQNVGLGCLQDSYLNAYVLLERVSKIDDLDSGALFEPRVLSSSRFVFFRKTDRTFAARSTQLGASET